MYLSYLCALRVKCKSCLSSLPNFIGSYLVNAHISFVLVPNENYDKANWPFFIIFLYMMY